jgi:hypothetical protein
LKGTGFKAFVAQWLDVSMTRSFFVFLVLINFLAKNSKVMICDWRIVKIERLCAIFT